MSLAHNLSGLFVGPENQAQPEILIFNQKKPTVMSIFQYKELVVVYEMKREYEHQIGSARYTDKSHLSALITKQLKYI